MTSTPHDRVAYDSMREYMMILEERGFLKRINAEVDLDYESGAISYRSLVRNGPGLLFENVKDYPDMPLVTNIMYSLDQLAIAFNGERDWVALEERVHEGMRNRLKSTVSPTGPVKEVVHRGDDVDLRKLPTTLYL